MNILMIGPSNRLKGGVASVVNNYIENFDKDNIKLIYCSTINSEKFLNKILNFCCFILKLIFLLIFKKIDLVHIHMASRGSYERKKIIINICSAFKKKIIVHLHGAEFKVYYEEECIEKKKEEIRKTFNKANMVLVLSKSWAQFIKKLTNTRVEVLYNCVSISDKIYYNSNNRKILFLGRLEERKGVYDLLDICKSIEKFDPNLEVLLCGDGNIKEVENIVSYKKLKNVRVLGWVNSSEKEKIIKETIINILPSYNEGMPMSILELMGKGICSISTNVGGIPEVIDNYKNGILITPGDKEMLLSEIINLVRNKDLCELLSINAYNKAKENFDIKSNISRLNTLYREIL